QPSCPRQNNSCRPPVVGRVHTASGNPALEPEHCSGPAGCREDIAGTSLPTSEPLNPFQHRTALRLAPALGLSEREARERCRSTHHWPCESLPSGWRKTFPEKTPLPRKRRTSLPLR